VHQHTAPSAAKTAADNLLAAVKCRG
jgi:hypothetical protein